MTIQAGNGNDTITNYQSVGENNKTFIYGGADDDLILNVKYYNSFKLGRYTIDGGNSGKNVTINGGAGNDTIVGSTISGYGEVIQYENGDENDVIINYGSDDTIIVTSGSYSTQTNNNDVIIKVGDGSMTLKDAKGAKLNIEGKHRLIEGYLNFNKFL